MKVTGLGVGVGKFLLFTSWHNAGRDLSHEQPCAVNSHQPIARRFNNTWHVVLTARFENSFAGASVVMSQSDVTGPQSWSLGEGSANCFQGLDLSRWLVLELSSVANRLRDTSYWNIVSLRTHFQCGLIDNGANKNPYKLGLLLVGRDVVVNLCRAVSTALHLPSFSQSWESSHKAGICSVTYRDIG